MLTRLSKRLVGRAVVLAGWLILTRAGTAAEKAFDAIPGKAGPLPASAGGTTTLRLELVRTEPIPVIGIQHPDAKDIPAGFEAGTTVKVTIQGKSAYHMVTTTMETVGATRWANMRTEHWISEDGSNWRRHKILFRPGKNPETGMWELTGSPFFFFDEQEDRWFIYFNFMAYDRRRCWNTPTLLRRAGPESGGWTESKISLLESLCSCTRSRLPLFSAYRLIGADSSWRWPRAG